MKFKNIFFLILLFSIIISIGIVSASDNNSSTDITSSSDLIDINEITEEESNLENAQDTDIFSQKNSKVIYVGQNRTTDGGNGTQDNPFNSFELACNNLTGEEKVEINVFNGTYYLDSDLKFNTSNLFINGIGDVVIKNLRNEPRAYASFGLTSSSGNFTFSNLTFDGSNCIYIHANADRYFLVFNGASNLGVFNNCSFINFNEALMFSSPFNRKFNYCNFLGVYNYLCLKSSKLMEFNYCCISSGMTLGHSDYYKDSIITFNNVWLGQNDYPSCTYYTLIDDSGYAHYKQMWPVNKQAIFSSWENYIGNDTFEILGKLTWDDGTTDGIEKLYPLTVKFSSKTGKLPQNTTLVNGTFKVIYQSESKDNHIEVTLDSEDIFLDFKNDIQVSAKPIIYGDDQNITITLPQSINSLVYINVNNKTYEVNVNNTNNFNFTVPDELLADTYNVTVKINDTLNHIYGMDSNQWNISKLDNELHISSPVGTNIDDKQIILTVFLEEDESGNITVISGNKNLTQKSNGGIVNINILNILHAGDNNITVVYSGNKRYMNQSKSDIITVNGVTPDINIIKPTNPFVNDSEINITVELPSNATGNITITVDNKNITQRVIKNTMSIDISNLLSSGENIVYIRYSGDDWWDSQIQKHTIHVSKLTSEMEVSLTQKTVKVGENIIIQVKLPSNANGNITVKIGNETNNFKTSEEIKVVGLTSGLNDINVTYNGNEIYNPKSFITNISVEKWSIQSNESIITITNHTIPEVTVKLPSDINGSGFVSINGKDYPINLENGYGSLKINDLTPNDYNAIFTFKGDNKYNNLTSNVMFYVPKPVLKANDMNIYYTSGFKYTVQVTASGMPVAGKQISFILNGKKTFAVTDNNGFATIKLNLPPKSTKYSVSAEYRGTVIKNKVKINSIVKAKNVKVKKSAKTLKIKVSLKKVDGKFLKSKKITLKFKGKTYKAKTNKKGVATFKIKKNVLKKLKKGKKYTYKVSYLKDIVNKKIIIK